MVGAPIEVWEFGPASDLADMVTAAAERRAPPSFVGHLLSTRGDALTVQLSSGAPSGDRRALHYVKGYGAFVLARSEEWPPVGGSGPSRLLVTLLAFPRPRTSLPSHP